MTHFESSDFNPTFLIKKKYNKVLLIREKKMATEIN